MPRTFDVSCSIGGALNHLDRVADLCEEAARPAAFAGIEVLYNEVKANVARVGRKSGNLANSIYRAYSKDKSGKGNATYHTSWRVGRLKGPDGKVVASASAPHGQLVEFGHIQRYVVYINKRGEWKTAVRPEMRGKPRPKRNASQAEKDAYYVPLKGGPKQVGASPFLRPARAKFPEARQAMREKYLEILRERGILK